MADITFGGMQLILNNYIKEKYAVSILWRLDKGSKIIVPPKYSWSSSAARHEYSLVLYEEQTLKEIARSKPVISVRCNAFNAEQLGYLLGTLKEIENEKTNE